MVILTKLNIYIVFVMKLSYFQEETMVKEDQIKLENKKNLKNKQIKCNALISQIRGHYDDVHTQGENTLRYIY